MARKIIDIGIVGNDGTGDSIRDSFRKVNDNFRELYSSLGLGEKLKFINLDDVFPDNYDGQIDPVTKSVPFLAVAEDAQGNLGLDFRRLVAGSSIRLDFANNSSEVSINSVFSELSADKAPQLGGNLSAKDGGNQYRIRDLTTPITGDEAVNKEYADRKISKAGVDSIDPTTGLTNSSFGRMSGPLILSRNPVPEDDALYSGLIAATKSYVDNAGFSSTTNLYVAKSGSDYRPGASVAEQGRSLSSAFLTLEAALRRAEELIEESPVDIGPYKKILTYNNGAGECTLERVETSPNSGDGFTGTVRMGLDTISINTPGIDYYVGDILEIVGGTIPTGGQRARIQVLTTANTPGEILSFRVISSGVYTSLPGTIVGVNIAVSAAPAGKPATGASATFNVTYKVNSVDITNGGSGYSLVSVRIEGGGGTGAFGTGRVNGGSVTGITITDQGSGFTSIPTLRVDLPRFFLKTEKYRTDFTGDVLTDTPEAYRGRDLREGLYLRGESSGALAQILGHTGALESDGTEIFDVDIQFGSFIDGEVISYGDITKLAQISILVESGIYEENLPLKIPQNVAIIGDEFRRVIIKPKTGTSSSPWAFAKFRRDTNIDGLNVVNQLYGYHYLDDETQPVYPKIDNKGRYDAAAKLLELNIPFLQEEVIAWIRYQVINGLSPYTTSFVYDSDLCKRDVGLIVQSIVYDLKYGGYNRTISSGLKYYQNASGLIAIGPGQLNQTIAAIRYLEALCQQVIDNQTITTVYNTIYPQIVDLAYTSETDPIVSNITIGSPTVVETVSAHNLEVGYPIEFSTTGALPVGMSAGTRYYVIADGLTSTQFKFSLTNPLLGAATAVNTSGTQNGTQSVKKGAASVVYFLINALIDVMDGSGSVNYPLANEAMDVFLCNDANIVRAVTSQGHGGFMMVFDPEGQILAKSPYAQECASFSRSQNKQVFAGGLFADGFTGNIQFTHETTIAGTDNTRLTVSNLERFPSLPCSFIVDDNVHRVNYVRDFVYNKAGSSATLVLDETTPFTRTAGAQTCTISIGSPAVITKADHRLQGGATIKFSTTGSLPTGIVAGQEYYVYDADITNNTFKIVATPGGSNPIATSGSQVGTHTYQRLYELLMPGNRSMLANDFTQINDLGYGAIATNGGLLELVSMFTYYCYISYYSINGGQIRSVSGSSAHGVYALVAEGADPLEVPTPTDLYNDLAQKVICYAPTPTYENSTQGLFIYVTGYDYVPLGSSELEIDHGNLIYRYPITSVATEGYPTGVARLNLTSDPTGNFTGLYAEVLNGTVMSLRQNAQIMLTGNLADVAVRPSTGLRLAESPADVYRVLQFTAQEDVNGPYEISVTNGSADIKVKLTITDIATNLCTTSQNHRLKVGDIIIADTTANGFTSGTTYYITDVPEYNQFYVSTVINGASPSLTDGSGLTLKFVKTHKLKENYTLEFSSTGTLPTPLETGDTYYVVSEGLTATSFRVSATKNGTAVSMTGTGSGTIAYDIVGLTKTTTRENYNFVDISLYQPNEFVNLSDAIATISIASPATITTSSTHELQAGDVITFSTTGALPTGITAGTKYYVISSGLSSTSFRISATNNGASINTSGSQSGVHSFRRYGVECSVSVASPSVISTVNNHGLVANDCIEMGVDGGVLSPGISAGVKYFVLSTGLTLTSFRVSLTPGGTAVNTTSTTVPLGTPYFKRRGKQFTVSVASPAVITSNGHGLSAGDVIKFETSGALPTGLSTSINYHVLPNAYSAGVVLSANQFCVSTAPYTATGAVAADTTGTQSGTHSFGKVSGRVGDASMAVVGVGTNDVARVENSIFVFKGEEYIITDYQSTAVTNKPYARIVLNRPLVDSMNAYEGAYTIRSGVQVRTNNATGTLTIRISLTRVTSHDLLDIGTGSYADTNYPNEIYGPAVNALDDANEVEERDVGRVFYVTTDQYGNFNVGPFFRVDQGTGRVTFSSAIALSNLDGLGFKRGVPIAEFSTDSSFSDNATDTVPTENAARIYIERRLGISHTGASVPPGLLIPQEVGGYMALNGQLAMKGTMNLDNNSVINISDPTNPQDAVNLRSLTWDNFQDFTPNSVDASDILVFTGSSNNSVNATVVGDVTFNLRPGVDSSLNQIDVQINSDTIINADVKSDADIAQSKLLLNLATTRAAAPSGTARDKQATTGTASFDSAQFTATDGFISVKDNGLVITKIAQIATKKVLGNAGLLTANVAEVDFSTVVSDGLGIKKAQYSSTGFLRRTNASSLTSDGDYTVVEAASGTSAAPEAGKLIIRDASGDFGARVGDLSQLNIDTNVTINSGTTATGGFIRYYAWGTAGGMIASNGSLATDRVTQYQNDQHQFLTLNGSAFAPVKASSIEVSAITTGGNTTAGTITGRWTLTGTSPNESRLQATYSADLAEYYEGDKEYEVGTVLVFGGDKEVTTSNIKGDTRVAGVVSNTAAFAMYEGCPGLKNLVALQGRVPCRVVGKITKGDILVTAGIPGVAIAATGDVRVGTVVGKALEDYDNDHIGSIEIAVGRT